MGPNGTGKSTLSSCIMGQPRYQITAGDILLNGESILPILEFVKLSIGTMEVFSGIGNILILFPLTIFVVVIIFGII